MPSRFFRIFCVRLLQAFAIAATCASLAHGAGPASADSPGLFETIGKFLAPAPAKDRALSIVPAGQGPRVALVVGMSAYPAGALENPRYDAAAMDAALKRLDFDVETTIDATKAQLDVVLRRFGNRAEKAEVAALFYAGHGLQVDGHNYIVPIDAKPQTVRDLKRDMIKLDDIIDDMGQAKVKLVFFDACRDNPLARSFSRGGTRGLAAPSEASGTLISFATKHGNTASDGDEKNSPYTQALLAELANPKGVEIETLMKNVSRIVKKKTGGQQEPWKYGSLDADFYFIFVGPTTSNAQQAPVDPETETWRAAESANQAAAYRAYLDAYPTGRYAVAAKIKLDNLQQHTTNGPERAQVAVPPAPTFSASARNEDPETDFWNEVKANGAREYLDAYLRKYPKGKYVVLAKVELKKLDEKVRAEREKDEADRKAATERQRQEELKGEQDAWEAAKSSGSLASYIGYLGSYPNGRYAALAKAAQQKLEREAIDRQKDEVARKEREAQEADQRAWEQAQRTNTEDAYRRYQIDRPLGRYKAQAGERLKQFEDDAAYRAETALWRKAESAKESATVQGYLDRYPGGRYAAEARNKLEAVTKEEAERRSGKVLFEAGQIFKECSECPEMVVVPAGVFSMGSGSDKSNAQLDSESPIHRVSISAFALGRTHVSRKQFASFANETGYDPNWATCRVFSEGRLMERSELNWKNPGFSQDENHPVVCINWNDARAYVSWLSRKTGRKYRLPSESEWEWASRAGAVTTRFWGDNPDQACLYANVFDITAKQQVSEVKWEPHNCNDGYAYTAPVASFRPNSFKLYDMLGNVWQWMDDCWHDNYDNAPINGSVWQRSECKARVLRGGSWVNEPKSVRVTNRFRAESFIAGNYIGFRVARSVP